MKATFSGKVPTGLRPDLRKLMACPLLPDRGTIFIKFVSPRTMSQYHWRFLGKNGPTDVLSFPFTPIPGSQMPPETEDYLGDILVCPQVVESDSRYLAVPVRVRFLKVVAHGVLHLLGMDHQTPGDAARMTRLENRLVRYALKE